MKVRFIAAIIAALPLVSEADFSRKEIAVKEVGLSLNSQRVFVKSTTLAADSECSDKAHYAMKLGSPESYLFYSAALSALNEGKKMRVQYLTGANDCLSNASQVNVFWNLTY